MKNISLKDIAKSFLKFDWGYSSSSDINEWKNGEGEKRKVKKLVQTYLSKNPTHSKLIETLSDKIQEMKFSVLPFNSKIWTDKNFNQTSINESLLKESVKLKEDYKNSEWEVYLKDEKGREKIVKKAKSKRAATILYNKIIKSDDYYEVGMRAIKEGKLTEGGAQIAKTILQQLGGNKFIAMTGAKNLGHTNKGLQMKIGKNSKGITHVKVTLTSMDTYEVEFIKVRGTNIKVVKKVKGVYADQLGEIFKKYTGMNVRL